MQGTSLTRLAADTWHGRAGDRLVVPPQRHDLEAVTDAVVLLTALRPGLRHEPAVARGLDQEEVDAVRRRLRLHLGEWYADALLRLAHRIGTRLTPVTRPLRLRDADRALVAAGDAVPDWSRGAVVVIFSDGWERGDISLLAEQVERLRRLAHRVVWVNPHRGNDGYAPVQQGIVAVLPHVKSYGKQAAVAVLALLDLRAVVRRLRR